MDSSIANTTNPDERELPVDLHHCFCFRAELVLEEVGQLTKRLVPVPDGNRLVRSDPDAHTLALK
eukprot:9580482-Heterocapsa_arctica.AAC.1